MTRLLQAPMLDGVARRLDAPAPVLDQATRDLLERAEADAYARGRADGARDARAGADQAAARTAAGVAAAVDTVRQELAADAEACRDAVVTLARQLAEAILDREVQAAGAEVVDRVTAAVAALDHGPFTVHVATTDHDLLSDHAHVLPADATIVVDARLAPGEVRITGPWSGAELTRRAMLDVLTEVAR